LFELVMAIPVAFALVHASLQRAHVIVQLIVSRFPPRLRATTEIFVSLLSLAVWTLIAWGGSLLAYESGLKETSETLGIPYLPFRIIWLFGLSIFCLSYILDISAAIRRFLGR